MQTEGDFFRICSEEPPRQVFKDVSNPSPFRWEITYERYFPFPLSHREMKTLSADKTKWRINSASQTVECDPWNALTYFRYPNEVSTSLLNDANQSAVIVVYDRIPISRFCCRICSLSCRGFWWTNAFQQTKFCSRRFLSSERKKI